MTSFSFSSTSIHILPSPVSKSFEMAEPLSLAVSLISAWSVIINARNALTPLSEATDRFLVMSFLPLQQQRIESIQKEIGEIVSRMQDNNTATLGHRPSSEPDDQTQLPGQRGHPLMRVQDGATRQGLTPEPHPDATAHTEELDRLLSKYAKAIRNYEILSQEALDPFEMSKTDRFFENVLATLGSPKQLQRRQARARAFQQLQGMTPKQVNSSFRELNRDFRIMTQKQEAFWERLWMGIFGGVAVIGPMILMVLKPDRNTSLITVSVATALFVLVLAIFAKGLAGKDVLAATAAYAAVLVVFVGTSLEFDSA
ncbi:hypothetical protein QBC41DRAFT_331484 [Cercophora samala]|uniref:DUF6594 domain-containing protein n=1 Tax=Cercophora samala TaxID=330535 RepID=A0AA39YVM9_9PEZI|nr:hypothetical protein QBC41DRAFT_331484 [Cercophora samala]